MKILTSLLSSLVSPIANVFIKREERKKTKITAVNKLSLAKANNEKEITLTDQEWEAISVKGLTDSWKDEYVTVICTSPYVLIILGAIFAAFGMPKLLSGITGAINALNTIGVDVGYIMEVVVYAAIGLKIARG